MKKIIVGAVAVATLAFGGMAYAQQDGQAPAQQAPGAQQQQGPGGSGSDCPEKDGQGRQETEV